MAAATTPGSGTTPPYDNTSCGSGAAAPYDCGWMYGGSVDALYGTVGSGEGAAVRLCGACGACCGWTAASGWPYDGSTAALWLAYGSCTDEEGIEPSDSTVDSGRPATSIAS
jgi:hypothetical protein